MQMSHILVRSFVLILLYVSANQFVYCQNSTKLNAGIVAVKLDWSDFSASAARKALESATEMDELNFSLLLRVKNGQKIDADPYVSFFPEWQNAKNEFERHRAKEGISNKLNAKIANLKSVALFYVKTSTRYHEYDFKHNTLPFDWPHWYSVATEKGSKYITLSYICKPVRGFNGAIESWSFGMSFAFDTLLSYGLPISPAKAEKIVARSQEFGYYVVFKPTFSEITSAPYIKGLVSIEKPECLVFVAGKKVVGTFNF